MFQVRGCQTVCDAFPDTAQGLPGTIPGWVGKSAHSNLVLGVTCLLLVPQNGLRGKSHLHSRLSTGALSMVRSERPKPGTMAYACNVSTREVEAGRPEVPGHPCPCMSLRPSWTTRDYVLKTDKRKKN